jgi:hypothetical protein
MLSDNLSTPAVTRIVEQNGQGLRVSQYTRINFTGTPSAHALTVFAQNGNTLTTEQISSQQHDFVRYQRIDLPKKAGGNNLDIHAVLGKWARLEHGQSVSGQLASGLFGQSLLDVLPMANLAPAQRESLLNTMREQHVFTYDSQLVKRVQLQGKPVYLYSVSIKPQAYVRVMQQFERLVGGTSYGSLKAGSFAHAKPIPVVLAVDARTHMLSQSYEVHSKRIERYEGFGVADTFTEPKTTITTAELTRRLGQLQPH